MVAAPNEEHRNQAFAEMAVLGSVRTVEQFQTLQMAAPSWILHGDIFKRMERYIAQHSAAPPPDVIKHWDKDWEHVEGEFEYWLEEYLLARAVYSARDAIKAALQTLEEEPTASISKLIEQLQGIGTYSATTAHALDSNVQRRVERYLERVRVYQEDPDRTWGIPTGLWAVDDTRQGWMPGELIGVYARPTVGKSWFLLRAGVVAWLTGRRVLFVSPEMTAEQVELRTDALLAGHMGIPFDQQAAEVGTPGLEAAYAQLQQTVDQLRAGEERWHTIPSGLTLGEIETQINYHDPDMVLVDGIMLMQDDVRAAGRKSWEQMLDFTYGLKRMATRYQTSIMVANQAVNSRRGRRSEGDEALGRGDDWIMPTLNDSAFGDSFVQAMSTIITMAPDRELEHLRWYTIRKARERKLAYRPRMALAWDVNRGIIIDLGQHGIDMAKINRELATYGIGGYRAVG